MYIGILPQLDPAERKEPLGMMREYTYHPKWGYREKKRRKAVFTDTPPPRVSVTVNRDVMDALSKEVGTHKVGVFVQVLLKDWIQTQKAERNKPQCP